jgi:cytochrome P450
MSLHGGADSSGHKNGARMDRDPVLQDFDDPDYDPDVSDELAHGEILDIYTPLRKAAQMGPVQEADFYKIVGLPSDPTYYDRPVFTIFGYDDIRGIMSNLDIVSQDHFRYALGLTFGPFSLTAIDPPHHPRYRRIFQKAFLPNVISGWSEEFVEPVIIDLIDKFAARGRCDLLTEFIRPYPFEIIYRQLRLPPEATAIFYRLAMALAAIAADFSNAREAYYKLGMYFLSLVRLRRKSPGTDLISVLATTELDGEFLPDEVVVSFLRQLMNAAGDTTYRSTSSMLTALLSERPDQFELLKNDRGLVAKAIEETLRWEGPVTMTVRSIKKDVVIKDVKIPAGAIVQLVLANANHDPNAYPEPEKFDLMRPQSRPHIAFAAGPHVCLGQHLARLEMARALNILLDRLPDLRLDPDYPRPRIRGANMRRARELRVRFD